METLHSKCKGKDSSVSLP